MRKWFNRLFRPKVRTLILVRRGAWAPQPEQKAAVQRFCNDNGAIIIPVMNPDGFRVLDFKPTDRLLVPKSLPRKVMELIAGSKPGEILQIDDDLAEQIHVVPAPEV